MHEVSRDDLGCIPCPSAPGPSLENLLQGSPSGGALLPAGCLGTISSLPLPPASVLEAHLLSLPFFIGRGNATAALRRQKSSMLFQCLSPPPPPPPPPPGPGHAPESNIPKCYGLNCAPPFQHHINQPGSPDPSTSESDGAPGGEDIKLKNIRIHPDPVKLFDEAQRIKTPRTCT